MVAPRRRPIVSAGSSSRSCPPNVIDPEVAAALGRSRISASAVIDLPLPLSPTSPTISPALTTKLTPSTACTVPPLVGMRTARSRTSRSGAVMS